VDVSLVFSDDLHWESCDAETKLLFDHEKADKRLGASIFWVRPSMLFLETVEEFIAGWQTTRAQTRRGIVEVQP
jgi:hypothetical protein